MYKATILVIDDEQRFLDIITNTLKASEYKVIQALNGEMGVMVAQKFIPDIIICDWEMPVMNGIDAIKAIKQDGLTKDIPIIMATGAMTSPENLNTALTAGAVDYIRKPIDPIELLARINSALKLAASYAEIIQKNQELHLLNTTKDKFFSIIAHDLRSPFNSILGLSNFLTEKINEKDSGTIEKSAKAIQNSAGKAMNLLMNLLEWSRSQSGRMEFSPEVLTLSILIDESFEILNETAEQKSIELSTGVPSEMLVMADKPMISTILRNLISNAIKYTNPGGKVNILAEHKQNQWVLSVSDNGVGIKKDNLENIFNIDSRLATNGTQNEKGTGLGLILCKELVEKHDGHIWVESEVGKGSTFYFTIPDSSEPI